MAASPSCPANVGDRKWLAGAEYEARHHFVCEPTRPNTNKVHYEFDRSFEKDKDPEHFTFDVSERIVDGMMDVFKGMVDEFDFVLEEVMEVALFTFFEVMSVPGSSYSCSSGGGGNNDLPRKKNDEDEEWLRAKQIAKAPIRYIVAFRRIIRIDLLSQLQRNQVTKIMIRAI